MGTAPLLAVEHLSLVADRGGHGETVPLVTDLSFELAAGEMLGVVGESGAGKSLTAYAILRLLPPGVRVTGGRILLAGEDLLALPERQMPRVRGRRIGLVSQEPLSALDPCYTIGFQITEAAHAHGRREARRRAVELLERVAMPDAADRLGAYPHELSGGQRQRALLAMALAAEPEVLLADEPTTSLDVTVQAEILSLLDTLRRDLGLAVVLITHDLAVVAETCDRVIVLRDGRQVEAGPVERVFTRPAADYTRHLLEAVPRLEAVRGPVVPGGVGAGGAGGAGRMGAR